MLTGCISGTLSKRVVCQELLSQFVTRDASDYHVINKDQPLTAVSFKLAGLSLNSQPAEKAMKENLQNYTQALQNTEQDANLGDEVLAMLSASRNKVSAFRAALQGDTKAYRETIKIS